MNCHNLEYFASIMCYILLININECKLKESC